MIDKYTAQAPTVDDATQKGLKALGISKDEAVIEVSKPGKKGFLGIGQEDAVVIVKRKENHSILDNVFSDNPIEREKLSKVRSTETVEKENEEESEEEPKKEQLVVSADPSSEAASTDPTVVSAEESDDSDGETIEPIAEDLDEIKEEESPEENSEESAYIIDSEEVDQQGIESVRAYLQEIVQQMGAQDVMVYLSREGKQVKYDIETEDAGLVIGRHGKVLNGLQTLAQTQLHKQAENKFFAKVDVENYRNRRKETIEQIARKTADKVKHTQRSVTLDPMPSHERKQIHRYLHSYPEVKTHSEGKEPHRYLVVEPAD